MKKLIVLVLLLQGCTHQQQVADELWPEMVKFNYIEDYDQKTYGGEYWQTPQETIDAGYKGDCDDAAILAYFILLNLGEKPEFVIYKTDEGYHMFTENDGYIYSNSQTVRHLSGEEIERFDHNSWKMFDMTSRSWRMREVMERMDLESISSPKP